MNTSPVPKKLREKVEHALLRVWLRNDDEFLVRRTKTGIIIKTGKVDLYIPHKT